MRQQEDAVAAVARAGRAGTGRASGGGEGRSRQTEELLTQSTGRLGGAPAGHPTRINPGEDNSVIRSLGRENSAAVILADSGYQVKQNPTLDEIAEARRVTGDTGDPRSKPDYLVEGRVFDCYSPGERTSVRNVWTGAKQKVVDEQTQRVVINLQDWRGDMSALRKQFGDWPVENLKEVKAIMPDGDIVQIIPEPRATEDAPHGD